MHSDLPKDLLHLELVVLAKLLPNLEDSGLEVTIDVSDVRILRGNSLSCWFWLLNLFLFLFGLTAFLFTLLPLFLFFLLLDSLLLSKLLGIDGCVDLSLKLLLLL